MDNLLLRILIIFLLLCSCLGTKSQKSNRDTEKKIKIQKEESVVNQQKEEKVLVLTYLDTLNQGKEVSLSDNDFDKGSENIISTPETNTTTSQVSEKRFRIQVLASNKIETVREAKKELEKKISEQISIGYEAPYYKLFVGSFLKKTDAKNLLMKLKNMGYTDAWIVTTSREEN